MNGCINKTGIGVLLTCVACVLPAEGQNSVSYRCPGAAEITVDDNTAGDQNNAVNKIRVQDRCEIEDAAGTVILSIGGIAGLEFTLIAETMPGMSATTTLTDAKFQNEGFLGVVTDLFDFGHTFPAIDTPANATISALDGTYDNSEVGGIISFADILLDPFVNGAAIGIINPPGVVTTFPPAGGIPFLEAIGPFSIAPVSSHSLTIGYSLDINDQIKLPTSAGIVTVPEPGSLILLTFGALMLARRRR